jgi:hypothetical protein
LLRHDSHVPARSAAERAEYDQIDLAAARAAEARERDYHFYGAHVQDPGGAARRLRLLLPVRHPRTGAGPAAAG